MKKNTLFSGIISITGGLLLAIGGIVENIVNRTTISYVLIISGLIIIVVGAKFVDKSWKE
ncbi:MAG: hypothetical protein ABIH34_03200 [Nanoarchaeota archaeon]